MSISFDLNLHYVYFIFRIYSSYKLEMPTQIFKIYFIIRNTNFTNCINIFVLDNVCIWFRTLSVFMNFSYGIQNIAKSKPCHHFNFSHPSLSIIELFIAFITIYISLYVSLIFLCNSSEKKIHGPTENENYSHLFILASLKFILNSKSTWNFDNCVSESNFCIFKVSLYIIHRRSQECESSF